MYHCPNCSGNLKFYIPTQMLRCDYCSTEMDPYDVQKDHDAVEENYFEATIFTCPECGGELISTDNEATAFCSFCGGSTILNSRISKEKRPDYIVPFQRTKDDCKKAWTSMMRRAIFAPKELRSAEYIDGFRGIYMPYWVYHITQKGQVNLDGTKSHRTGDYIVTEHYDLTGYLNGDYNGLSCDASSSFADNLSEAIAPYDVKGLKKFTPSFLSGFYADTADVDKSVYQDDMMRIAVEASVKEIKRVNEFKNYSLGSSAEKLSNAGLLNSRFESIKSGMFPVWFMSYRNGDRVAYATINGQTGKVAADLPVDTKKFLVGSILLAVPIFILLNLTLTLKPTILLSLAMLLALFALALYSSELTQIVRKDSGLDDKGALSRKGSGEVPDVKPSFGKKCSQWMKKNMIVAVILVIVGMNFVLPLLAVPMALLSSGSTGGNALWILPLAVGVALSATSQKKLGNLTFAKKRPGYIGAMLSLVIASAIFLINPVADACYYAGTVACMIAVFFTLTSLMHCYNVLATRRLPQFDKKGGDDYA